jgi:transposase-like protein
MPRRHRSHSNEFKQKVVAEYHAGETLHALGRRHDVSRNLIRIWIEKAEAGALDEVSIGPLIAGPRQACFYVRAGVMVFFEVMASC